MLHQIQHGHTIAKHKQCNYLDSICVLGVQLQEDNHPSTAPIFDNNVSLKHHTSLNPQLPILFLLTQFRTTKLVNLPFLLFLSPPKLVDCSLNIIAKFVTELKDLHYMGQDCLSHNFVTIFLLTPETSPSIQFHNPHLTRLTRVNKKLFSTIYQSQLETYDAYDREVPL